MSDVGEHGGPGAGGWEPETGGVVGAGAGGGRDRPGRAGRGGMEHSPQEAMERHRSALLVILRVAFSAIFVVMLVLSLFPTTGAAGPEGRAFGEMAPDWHLKLGIGVLLALIVVAVDIFTPRKKISTLGSVFFGLLVAMLATLAIGSLLDLLATLYRIQGPQAEALLGTIKVFIGIALAYLAISTVLQTQDDFRLVIPYVEFAKQMRGMKPLLLDSSALIDARIADIGEAGAIQAPLIIPQFVVSELQMLADSHNRMKRARGRRGLDIIGRLQRSASLDVSIDETPVPGKAVDQMLIELAKQMPAAIMTTDLGLTRVARIQGVHVLNLNDLANAMKPSFLPGEEVCLRLVKPGEQPGQGVGYLDDGTMVVAENGGQRIGDEVTLQVTSSLQTSAGRLIFARLTGPDEASADADGSPAPARPEPAPQSSSRGEDTDESPDAGAAGEGVDANADRPGAGNPPPDAGTPARSDPGPGDKPGSGRAQRGRPPSRGRNPRR